MRLLLVAALFVVAHSQEFSLPHVSAGEYQPYAKLPGIIASGVCDVVLQPQQQLICDSNLKPVCRQKLKNRQYIDCTDSLPTACSNAACTTLTTTTYQVDPCKAGETPMCRAPTANDAMLSRFECVKADGGSTPPANPPSNTITTTTTDANGAVTTTHEYLCVENVGDTSTQKSYSASACADTAIAQCAPTAPAPYSGATPFYGRRVCVVINAHHYVISTAKETTPDTLTFEYRCGVNSKWRSVTLSKDVGGYINTDGSEGLVISGKGCALRWSKNCRESALNFPVQVGLLKARGVAMVSETVDEVLTVDVACTASSVL